MTYKAAFDVEAEADLLRLYDCLLERAEYLEDLEVAQRAVKTIQAAVGVSLATSPLLYRKALFGGSLRRELVVAYGSAGYVVQYEVASPDLVVVLAVRHQREQDRN